MTFYLVLLGWVLFRATSIEGAWQLFLDLHTFSGPEWHAPVAMTVLS